MDQLSTRPAASTARGRPVVTSHEAIEREAFRLFAEKGFAETTIDDIARAVGIGKRTLFRYYPSKNDIPWGQFRATLEGFEATFAAIPDDVPLAEAVRSAVISFNDFEPGGSVDHRDRMRLILSTPELQAHSVHQYLEWRRVIADYVARRSGQSPDDLLPQLVGQVSLALALTAYEQWLRDDSSNLLHVLSAVFDELEKYLIDN